MCIYFIFSEHVCKNVYPISYQCIFLINIQGVQLVNNVERSRYVFFLGQKCYLICLCTTNFYIKVFFSLQGANKVRILCARIGRNVAGKKTFFFNNKFGDKFIRFSNAMFFMCPTSLEFLFICQHKKFCTQFISMTFFFYRTVFLVPNEFTICAFL